MRQDNKRFGADIALGEELVNLARLETSNAPTHSDSSLITQKEPLGAGDGMGAKDVNADTQNEIVRDMTLLADVVMQQRAARRGDPYVQDWQDFPAGDLSGLKDAIFPPVRIAVRSEDAIDVVDSIERAVECLTTLWPVRCGEAFEGALQACIDGIKGRASPQQVRLAFVNAADEAGILIIP